MKLQLEYLLPGVVIFIYTFIADDKQFTNKKKLLVDTKKMICEKCKEKYKTEYIQIPVCPKCDGKLVGYKESINNDTGKPVS